MIEAKLQQAEKRYQELSDRLVHPDTFSNSAELQKISKEHADLDPLIRKIQEFRKFSRENFRNSWILRIKGSRSACSLEIFWSSAELEKVSGWTSRSDNSW